ncbi:TetR/AcrR family transcriptional regulator [Paenibacillus alba]|uniref:TetR/AcrR family transcriptional regulator n=1 Tax=Paenibacillus alba TaxID=1197127 RepID=UPI001565645B|nr:TetR/AcrR family transcriptional regulator [Paenibacillus alba]NQX67999.1 TetR/AcrR family transcriptional regulator [Paenibacillus alba]
MNDKKMKLIQAALKLFSEHDYHTTSVQDIVSLAGISKGSFYQYFHSKEEVFTSIISYYFEKITAPLQGLIEAVPKLPPKEVLIKGLSFQCDLIVENRELCNLFLKGVACNDSLINEIVIQHFLWTNRWFQERITELYGQQIEPHAMDCAAMLDGTMKSYYFLQITFGVNLNSAQLSDYLFERLDDWVYGILRKQSEPVLDSQMMKLGLSAKIDPSFDGCIDNIRQWIRSNVKERALLDNMIQSIEALIAEMQKEQCNPVIVQGMYSYLSSLSKPYDPLVKMLEEFYALHILSAHTQTT